MKKGDKKYKLFYFIDGYLDQGRKRMTLNTNGVSCSVQVEWEDDWGRHRCFVFSDRFEKIKKKIGSFEKFTRNVWMSLKTYRKELVMLYGSWCCVVIQVKQELLLVGDEVPILFGRNWLQKVKDWYAMFSFSEKEVSLKLKKILGLIHYLVMCSDV